MIYARVRQREVIMTGVTYLTFIGLPAVVLGLISNNFLLSLLAVLTIKGASDIV